MEKFLIGPEIKHISEEIDKRINAQNRPFRLTLAQGRIVLFLSEQKDHEARQNDLVKLLGVAHSTMISMLASMKQKGMVEVKSDPADKRGNIIHLTYGDEAVYEKLEENAEENERVLLEGFTEEEKKQFREYLCRAHENLKTHEVKTDAE